VAPGDEFEKAQKKLTSTEIDGPALFAGHPNFRPSTRTNRLSTPARQTRITGVTKIKVSVAKDGSVESADGVTGHPLLVQALLDAVRNGSSNPEVDGSLS